MEDRVKELENALKECVDYVKGCIGSSYCETSQDDYEFLNELETTLNIPLTTKSTFY